MFPWCLLVSAERVNNTVVVWGERHVPMGVSFNLQLYKHSQNAQRRGELDWVTAQHSLNVPAINTWLACRTSLLSSNLEPLVLQAPTRPRRERYGTHSSVSLLTLDLSRRQVRVALGLCVYMHLEQPWVMVWQCSVQRLTVESERGQCFTLESDEGNGLAFCEAGEEIFLLRSVVISK